MKYFLLFIFCFGALLAEDVSFSIVTPNESIQPGTPFLVGLLSESEEGTHFYGQNPGKAGKPTIIKLFLPKNFKASPIKWPKPEKFLDYDIKTFGYEGRNLFIAEIYPPKNLTGNIELSIKVEGLICDESSCIPFSKIVSLALPVKNSPPKMNRFLEIEFLQSSHTKQLSIWLLLAFAFLGGIILNVMPCVFPVISLKILHFVKLAGKERSAAVKHGLAFGFGILISFWVLTGLLLILKMLGSSLGWGFQLQNPIFVAVMICFFFIFALILLGVFEFGQSLISLGSVEGKFKGTLSSFFSGVLAVIVATPCTGPFLGTAIGATLTMPPILVMTIFTSIALGMALPYLILAMHTPLLKLLPKQGPWTIYFKQLLGFVMMAVVIWLVWVFGAQTNHIGVLAILLSLLIIGFGCWLYGVCENAESRVARFIFTALSIALIALGCYAAVYAAKKTNVEEKGDWTPFSEEKVESLREEGKPLFIDFTAKWCLICQANKAALYSDVVRAKFEELGVVTMVADFTEHDEKILAFMQKFGRNSVPLYLFYPEGRDGPIILPQLLIPETILNYLEKEK